MQRSPHASAHPRDGRCVKSVAVACLEAAPMEAEWASSAAPAARPSSTSSTMQARATLSRSLRAATSCKPPRRAATSLATADTFAGGGNPAGALYSARCAACSVRNAAPESRGGSGWVGAASARTPHVCAAHASMQLRARSRSRPSSAGTALPSSAQRPCCGTCAAQRS